MPKHLRKGHEGKKRRQLRAAMNRVLRGIGVAAYLKENGVKSHE
jgi:hypothetical protein